MKRPNTFIIGAPKCGTTALSEYLRSHPNVYVCHPKEPQYWSNDIKEADNYGLLTDDDYLQIFSEVSGEEKIVIDASTNYLWSNVAVKNIINFNGDAKFIVMIRNPIEVAQAYHMEESYWLHEDVTNFEDAWNLVPRRRLGLDVPKLCPDPQKLDYERIASLGKQLKSVLQIVPKENVHVIVLDDMKKDPRFVYLSVLDFLQISDDRRTAFPVINTSKAIVNQTLSKWMLYPPNLVKPVVNEARKLLWQLGIKGVRSNLYNLVNQQKQRKQISNTTRVLLEKAFAKDICLIEELLSRDLQHWKCRETQVNEGQYRLS